MTIPRLSIFAILISASLAGGALAADTAAARHAITHEDVWLMKRVGAPLPSPDGKWAVFSVTDPAYDSKEQWSDLWIKSLTDDTPARRLVAGVTPAAHGKSPACLNALLSAPCADGAF